MLHFSMAMVTRDAKRERGSFLGSRGGERSKRDSNEERERLGLIKVSE